MSIPPRILVHWLKQTRKPGLSRHVACIWLGLALMAGLVPSGPPAEPATGFQRLAGGVLAVAALLGLGLLISALQPFLTRVGALPVAAQLVLFFWLIGIIAHYKGAQYAHQEHIRRIRNGK